MTNKSPVDIIIERFGGVVEVAKIVDRDHSAVCQRKSLYDGTLPRTWIAPLREEAKKRRIRLTLQELVDGA